MKKGTEQYRLYLEQKREYYHKNRLEILDRLKKKRDAEQDKLLENDPYDQSKKTPDVELEKQAIPLIMRNAPKFREMIREIINEYEEEQDTTVQNKFSTGETQEDAGTS